MNKFLLTMFFLSIWVNGIAQITGLTIDTTVNVNTTGPQPIETTNYPDKLDYLADEEDLLENELNIRIFSFTGHGDSVYITTDNADFDTYLLLYEKINESTYVLIAENDDEGFGGFGLGPGPGPDFEPEPDFEPNTNSKINWLTVNGTEYHIIVGGYNNESGNTDLSISNTLGAPEYCSLYSTRNRYEWIKRIELTPIIGIDIDNSSGQNTPAYGDYTDQTLEVIAGDIVNVTLTPGYKRRVYTEYWRIWADWNYDGDFDDEGEKVFEKSGKNVQTGSFNVPLTANSNTLRIRVSMRWKRNAPSCGTFRSGEVEDYTIHSTNLNEEEEELGPDDFPPLRLSNAFDTSEEINTYESFTEIAELTANPIHKGENVSGIVRVSETGVKTFRLTNVLGQVVTSVQIDCTEDESSFAIPTNGLNTGIYFLNIDTDREATKIVIR